MLLPPHIRTPRDACYAVGKAAGTEIGKLVSRPWNMYEPETTAWWLVPSSNWPAYQHGKLRFDWLDAERKSLVLGLYMEKGLGPAVGSVYQCPKGLSYIMQSDWSWHRLLRDLENGQMQERIRIAASSVPSPMQLVIDGGYVADPCEFDPHAPDLGWFKYRFELNAPTGALYLTTREAELKGLEVLSGLKSFGELRSVLEKLPDDDWLWVDFYLDVSLEVQEAGSRKQQGPVWTATDCWRSALCWFRPWLQ